MTCSRCGGEWCAVDEFDEQARGAFDDCAATQLEQMRRDLADLRARGVVPDADCTCGSGGHPRPCAKHPHRMEMHAREIDAENALEQMRRERDARPPLTRDDVIILINVISDDIVQPDLGWFGDIVDRLRAFVGGVK